jgi:hypothetical protein
LKTGKKKNQSAWFYKAFHFKAPFYKLEFHSKQQEELKRYSDIEKRFLTFNYQGPVLASYSYQFTI